jgi:hypothetical protein
MRRIRGHGRHDLIEVKVGAFFDLDNRVVLVVEGEEVMSDTKSVHGVVFPFGCGVLPGQSPDTLSIPGG